MNQSTGTIDDQDAREYVMTENEPRTADANSDREQIAAALWKHDVGSRVRGGHIEFGEVHPYTKRQYLERADAVLALRAVIVPRVWFEAEMARLKDALGQRDQLRAVIENAPHAELCTANGWRDECDCWKAELL